MNTDKPIFLQIIDMIEDDILTDVYPPNSMIISTTQISKLLGVNPTTAVKAVSILTDKGILYKKRGLGMAVTDDAKNMILTQRKQLFYETAVPEFLAYAQKIGITKQHLISLLSSQTSESNTATLPHTPKEPPHD